MCQQGDTGEGCEQDTVKNNTREIQRAEKLQRMIIHRQSWQGLGKEQSGSTVTEVTASSPTALALLTLPRTGSECQGHTSLPRKQRTALYIHSGRNKQQSTVCELLSREKSEDKQGEGSLSLSGRVLNSLMATVPTSPYNDHLTGAFSLF